MHCKRFVLLERLTYFFHGPTDHVGPALWKIIKEICSSLMSLHKNLGFFFFSIRLPKPRIANNEWSKLHRGPKDKYPRQNITVQKELGILQLLARTGEVLFAHFTFILRLADKSWTSFYGVITAWRNIHE